MHKDFYKPRIDFLPGRIDVDCTTRRTSGSSTNQFVDDPDTEVYYGHEIRVSMRLDGDTWLSITMDTYKGDWKNAQFARAEAMECLKSNLSLPILLEIIEFAQKQGFEQGERSVRAQLRGVLGIEDEGRGGRLFLKV